MLVDASIERDLDQGIPFSESDLKSRVPLTLVKMHSSKFVVSESVNFYTSARYWEASTTTII